VSVLHDIASVVSAIHAVNGDVFIFHIDVGVVSAVHVVVSVLVVVELGVVLSFHVAVVVQVIIVVLLIPRLLIDPCLELIKTQRLHLPVYSG